MKALIFGAGGQVGQALVETAPQNAELTVLDRRACDVAVQGAVEAAIAGARADLVINAAAYTAVDKAETEPECAQTLNADAPARMAAAARGAGARFLHISTDFVFGPSAGAPLRTGDPTDPQSVYGRTKRDGEITVLAANPASLIVRTAWVYASTGSNFVLTMLRLMRERARLTIVADQVGTPTYAASLAQALWALAAAGATGIHHFTDAGVASWYDFAVAIQEEALALGLLERSCEIVPISTKDYPTPARRPAYSVLEKTETWALLNGPPAHWRVNLRTCLGEMAR